MEPKDYIVKKIEGEYATLKDKETGEEQDDKMFMKKAHFFTFAQVEKIEK